MGIRTVAVYSEADREALHTQLADESICIGEASPTDSYLNMQRILSATIASKAEAIHPGFGFLSENARFASLCEKCNIAFIGPSSEIIQKMGNKSEARNSMIAANVPVIPGSDQTFTDAYKAKELADSIGYPVMIKAALGGGGKGMRVVRSQEDFIHLFQSAQFETKNAFADQNMYIEKFVENGKHIEVQILADHYGNVIHLGERDCSIQRHHQKMIEETPSPAINQAMRNKIGAVAIRAAKAVGYTNAGTIEFILDQNQQFYFMEINTRIQVEHGITELLTGVDLVKEQIRIAAGEELHYKQKDIHFHGHVMEARINAEDPKRKFMPCPGLIKNVHIPGGNGIRVDTAVYSGYTIPPYYDSMIMKIMAYDADRTAVISKLKSALGEVVIDGINTNLDLQYEILDHPKFQSGDFDTNFLSKEYQL